MDSTPPITEMLGSPAIPPPPPSSSRLSIYFPPMHRPTHPSPLSADEKLPKSKEPRDRQSEYGLVWIMYICYARRAHDLKTFQAVFARARN